MGKGEVGIDVNSSAKEDDGEEEGEDEMPRQLHLPNPPKINLKNPKPHQNHCPALTLTDEQAALAAPGSNQLHLQLRKR